MMNLTCIVVTSFMINTLGVWLFDLHSYPEWAEIITNTTTTLLPNHTTTLLPEDFTTSITTMLANYTDDFTTLAF